MKIGNRLFRSKLAHRVFLAFVSCALVPIGVVAVVSYRSVTDQLVSQAYARLKQAAKGQGLSLYERLLFAETELTAASRAYLLDQTTDLAAIRGDRLSSLAIATVDETGANVDWTTDRGGFRLIQREEHLARGRSILLPIPEGSGLRPVRLAMRLNPEDPASLLVVGELDPTYFWGLDGGNAVPADAEYCVFEESGALVYGSFAGCGEAWSAARADRDAKPDAGREVEFRVSSDDEEIFVAGYRDLFLDARFGASDWVILVCEPRSIVLKPVERWRVLFPALVLTALWVVLLLIIAAIRKNLDPIDLLRRATDRIARREFDHRVELHSGDEFEQLAEAFNDMSDQLRRQFSAMAATSNIQQAILSTLETSRIAEATISGMLDYFEADLATVIILRPDGGSVDRTLGTPGVGEFSTDLAIEFDPELQSELQSVHPGVVLGHDRPIPPNLASLLGLEDMQTVVATPIFVKEEIQGTVGLGYGHSRDFSEDTLEHFTQIADQFAVALSNSWLVSELNEFSWGTLEALARAVDAKSPWTAGHSERVTQLAVAIGAALDLDPTELVRLHRGAMLHDIGKLGISQQLLDKKSRLDRNEFSVVMSHTMIGERILEPIGAFADIMPVVTQHHERFDGTGYPAGLTGDEIDIKARILSVADVYDAMTNPRPYRDSVEPHEVVDMIRAQAGTQFDPIVVNAFMKVIGTRGVVDYSRLMKQDLAVYLQSEVERPRAAGDTPTGQVS
jgi:HAMP domain-containing protein